MDHQPWCDTIEHQTGRPGGCASPISTHDADGITLTGNLTQMNGSTTLVVEASRDGRLVPAAFAFGVDDAAAALEWVAGILGRHQPVSARPSRSAVSVTASA